MASAKWAAALLLLAAIPSVALAFVSPVHQRIALRSAVFQTSASPALRPAVHRRRTASVLSMMAEDEDEWFNPGAVAKLARSAPVVPKRTPIIEAPAPTLLEGVLEWGYYAGMSWEGRGKGTQVGGINNQDSIIASSLEESILFGVFDGHGEYGGEASNYVVETLPTNVLEVEAEINAAGMNAASAQPPFEAAYAKTHQQLLEQTAQGGFDTFLSGSTCITVLVGLFSTPPVPHCA